MAKERKRKPSKQSVFIPTPAELESRCAEVRKGWTKATEKRRRCVSELHQFWCIPIISYDGMTTSHPDLSEDNDEWWSSSYENR